MKIIEIIKKVKDYSNDTHYGKKIMDNTTRDQILYGDPNQECTGIVTTCYPSIDVIRKAGEKGMNFVICHESAFWNHGDHTDWLRNNTAFIKKKELLDKYKICLWRDHDYIHAGLKFDKEYRDGIFYGMCSILGWDSYVIDNSLTFPRYYEIPEMNVMDFAKLINTKFRLNGVRLIGNQNTKIKRVYVPLHIMGRLSDSDLIAKIDQEKINCLLTLEMVDFTVCEYIRDAGMLKEDKCILALGHFNMEEIGMEYFAQYLKEQVINSLPISFIQSGDSYSYIQSN